MRRCLTPAQSSTTWFVATFFKLTAPCSCRLHPHYTSPVCRFPALEQKLLHSLLGIHPLQRAPLFSLTHTFCGHMRTLCIRAGTLSFPFLLLSNSCLYVIAAPAMRRIWIKSQLLPTPFITVSQLSILLITVGKQKHFYLPDTPSFRYWDS